jgi:hypothetical protein
VSTFDDVAVYYEERGKMSFMRITLPIHKVATCVLHATYKTAINEIMH